MAESGKWRILLIDDEPDIRDVISLALDDAGYAVATAADGATGIARCTAFKPQIVITDIRMPVMDGLEVLAQVKQRFADTEVIVATAFGEMPLAVKALRLDASDFITKPIDNEALLVALARARQRYTTRQQLKQYTRFLEAGWSGTMRELMETFAYQRNLIESSMDGIVGCNTDGTVVTFNRSMTALLGYTQPQVLHRLPLAHFFAPDELARFQRNLAAPACGGHNRLLLYETHMLDQDRRQIPVQLSAAAMSQDEGAAGVVCFVRDLRQIRRLEQEMADQVQILHRDKMMSLGRLAASVAHEINNPLSGILNYLRLMTHVLKRGAPDADRLQKFRHYLDVAQVETQRCSDIVSSLLTFARKSPPAETLVEPADLLKRCEVLSRHRLELESIQLTTRIPPNLPTVKGNANQLQQCLINLIFNAVDAMPDGGRLTLAAEHRQPAGEICITVADSGGGIAAEHLPHIFEPFFTTKPDGHGVGLGLSTTYSIVERHGGTLTVSSRPGRGTTFRLQLPAVEAT